MARMRLIGTTLDDGYRDDLNFNFGLLEALIGESNGLTEALRQEMLEKIYNLQTQIDMLTGENIGELLARLNDAIQQALTAAQEARTAKTATEEATALAMAAKELAIASATLADEKATYAEGKAILAQEAADNANQEATNLGQMKVAVVQATQDANTATSNSNQATEEAQAATNAINAVLPNVTGLENLQEWSSTIAYKKNNFVTFEGNGYMALQNNINISPPSFPTLSNDDWAMLVQRGEKGEQGTGVRILGTLVNESELPSIGEPGDAYLINGDLYVWSDTTDDWTNVGTIKGPKGDQGIQGPKGDKGDKGDPGEDADVEAINQQIDTLRTEVTEQLEQMKPKVDNSWQKGVYNDTDIMNLSQHNAKRTILVPFTEWKDNGNVEKLDLTFNVGSPAFSGLIKITATSFWRGADGSGGATVLYRIGQYTGGAGTVRNDVVVETVTPNFADCFFFNQAYLATSGYVVIPILKTPTATNSLSLTVEVFSVANNVFEIVKGMSYQIKDEGNPSVYWTKQTSRIPTGAQINNWDRKSDSIAFDKSGSEGAYPDPNTFLDTTFITNHANAISEGQPNAFWYIEQVFYGGNGEPNARSQFARSYNNVNNPDMKVRHYHPNEGWSKWSPSIQQLFTSVSNGKAQVASAITGKGVQTASDATFETMANNIRAIPTGSRTQSGSMQIPAFSGSQTVSVNVYLPFVAKNALSNMGGFVFLNGYPYGATGVAGPYTRNITVAGTTLTFTFAMGGGTGSFAGGTGTYFASE